MARSTPLAIPSTTRDVLWSDIPRNPSDVDVSRPMRRSSSPMSTWINQTSSTTVLHTGQLSPVSPGVDPTSSSASSMVNSAASSYTDTWCMDSLARDEAETPWTEDSGLMPKVEVLDDEFDLMLERVPPVGMTELGDRDHDLEMGEKGFAAEDQVGGVMDDKAQKTKRPRGRPRKHPLTPAVNANKSAKGRSKTGCITCRKRKKKCDEAKPRCMNCEKNAVVCEGYHEKQIWKSGKERAEEARLRRESLPSITMPPIFHGVETPEDKIFWHHYCNHLSNVLTIEGEHRNAFKDIVLRLATRHEGLMHAVLSLSAAHIDYETPYGMKILHDGRNGGGGGEFTMESLRDRAVFHHDAVMRCLSEDTSRSQDKDDPEYLTVLTAWYGQMLCLLLRTMVEGNPRGEHRVHLQAYRKLIRDSPPDDPSFLAFITEFFEYHIFADELLSPVTPEGRMTGGEYPTASTHPPRLIGVTDGLFSYMSQIASIRDTIRANIHAGADEIVDYPSLYQAAEIDAQVRDWMPCWPAGDSRNRVALLYKQAVWVYLFRTIYPPGNVAQRVTGVPEERITGQMGQMSAFSSESESSDTSRRPSTNTTPSPPSSPPPIRKPELQDPRITTTVDESLSILEDFKPSDPAQRLLLIPCLILGTACFGPEQQERVRRAVRGVRGYTGLRNCDMVSVLLEEVWGLMAIGEWGRVWDWEEIARGMGIDFLCA